MVISELVPLWKHGGKIVVGVYIGDKLEEWFIVTELFVLKFEVDVTEVKIKKSYSNQAVEKEVIVFY